MYRYLLRRRRHQHKCVWVRRHCRPNSISNKKEKVESILKPVFDLPEGATNEQFLAVYTRSVLDHCTPVHEKLRESLKTYDAMLTAMNVPEGGGVPIIGAAKHLTKLTEALSVRFTTLCFFQKEIAHPETSYLKEFKILRELHLRTEEIEKLVGVGIVQELDRKITILEAASKRKTPAGKPTVRRIRCKLSESETVVGAVTATPVVAADAAATLAPGAATPDLIAPGTPTAPTTEAIDLTVGNVAMPSSIPVAATTENAATSSTEPAVAQPVVRGKRNRGSRLVASAGPAVAKKVRGSSSATRVAAESEADPVKDETMKSATTPFTNVIAVDDAF